MNEIARSEWARRVAMAPGAVYALILLSLIFGLFTTQFLTVRNLTNVGMQGSVLVIVALGMTLIILSEGIDLSLGPILGLAGVVLALAVKGQVALPLAILAAIAVGGVFGALNGVLIAHLGLPPFVVTLGSFGMAQGLALVLTEGASIPGLGPAVQYFNDGQILGVQVPIVLTAITFLVVYVILYHTRFGTYVFAIGGNQEALTLAGVRTRLYKTGVYVLGGILAGVGALVMTARMNAAHPTVGVGLEFDAIASVILGGTSFERGKGWLGGTIIGALAVCVLRNGLNLIGLSTSWQVSMVGTVIILAIVVDALRGI
ncbi:MAG TPA: ABC transporter permease [Candidatus Methylomirabilis sp.]|nr:ABC transporter permease [Candidatus Methylomirabilis sp.]HSC71350.1 ABC transporter permease [Candidatus Methylomirabilis sp.]